jgi:hypothetical protein
MLSLIAATSTVFITVSVFSQCRMALVSTRINPVNALVKVLDEVGNGMMAVPVRSVSIGRVSDGWFIQVGVVASQ